MGRTRKIKVSGINIRVHTRHDPAEYFELWKALHKLKWAKIRGPSALMIGDMRKINESSANPQVFGYFYRFINIDPADPWFDIEEHKKADAEDVAEVVIPKKLKPSLQEFPYLFDLKTHKLFFKSGGYGGGISPGVVHALLEQLVGAVKIKARFTDVEVTTLTDTAAIEKLLRWPVIKKINVVLERPNPTDFDDEVSFFERLQRRGVKREVITYTKQPGVPSIMPDTEMKAMIKIAADNGKYTQTGIDESGDETTASSVDFPLQETANYDPNLSLEKDAFVRLIDTKLLSISTTRR